MKRSDLSILVLASLAGFLVALFPCSVLLLLLFLASIWFLVDNFETALILLVFYLPFQVALNLSAGFDLASGRALILVFGAAWLLRSLKDKHLEIDGSPETLLLAVFLLLASASLGWAPETDRALRKLLVFASVFPLYFVLTSFAGRKDLIWKTVRALLLGGAIISGFGILQFLAQFIFGINPLFDFFARVIAPLFYGNTFAAQVVANPSWLVNVGGKTLLRAFAIFSDPHIFSFYLGLVAPLAFALAILPEKSKPEGSMIRNKKFMLLALLFLLLAELLTFSRGGYMGMFASLLVLVLLFWRRFSAGQRKVLSRCFILGIIFVTFVSSSVLTRFLSSFDFQEGSNLERMKNWQQGMNAFQDNFFWGTGIGNYSYYLDPTNAYRTPIYAHNLYLDLGAEMGVFALLSWVSLILFTMAGLYRTSRRSQDQALSYLALGLIGSLIWYSVHSFFDDSIFAPNILAVLVVILALAALVTGCGKRRKMID